MCSAATVSRRCIVCPWPFLYPHLCVDMGFVFRGCVCPGAGFLGHLALNFWSNYQIVFPGCSKSFSMGKKGVKKDGARQMTQVDLGKKGVCGEDVVGLREVM